jgi:serine/threonine-protein kinase
MEELTIKQIGRYQILDVIGRGGMGVVYRAIDTTIDRQVAIKMLLGGGGEDRDNMLARFHREARSTGSLQHPNIVTVYALDDFEGFPYMVMEFLEGKSMAEMITSGDRIPLVDKLGLICQVCDGLQYAHDRNVIHRDIKPANILVLKDGVTKIVDFGIARMGQNDSLTRTGQIIGSVYYMPPEQITGGSLDSRSDIYSAGVTLYQFLTGELPFKGSEKDVQATFFKILNDPVPSLGKYLNGFPLALDEILFKAMARDVEARYQTAEDLGYDLSRLQESLKQEMTGELLAQALAEIETKAWEPARQKLQEVLRLDRRNSKAKELSQLVRQEIQREQKSIQIGQLGSQAEMALSAHQFEEAFECAEQARRLDPNNEYLNQLSKRIHQRIELAKELVDALRRGQAALYAGDIEEAGLAIHQALIIDTDNTEARTLEGLVRQELEDRARRANFQEFTDDARLKIASRDFLAALRSLEKAKAIDPENSNIRELLNWAARGYEQEKLRNELRKYTDEIGKLLAENRFSDALMASANALQRFPDDPPLLKLQDLAQRQYDLVKHRHTIDEAGKKARLLADENKWEEAIQLLETLLQTYPDEANLLTLLAITRSEAELKEQEKQEREQQISSLAPEPICSSLADVERQLALERLKDFQTGLARRLPLAQLSELASQARDAAKLVQLDHREEALLSVALSDFEMRSAKYKRDYAELERLKNSLSAARSATEIDSLLDRARALSDQHPRDEEIRICFESVQSVAETSKRRREDITAQISAALHSIESNGNLTEISKIQKRVQELSAFWLEDPYVRALVDQTEFHVDEIQKNHDQVLKELGRMGQSIETARSGGQIRFLHDQARMLATELQDAEILKLKKHLELVASERLEVLAKVVAGLTEELSEIGGACSISEVERHEAKANSILAMCASFEESADLMRRIQRSVEEKNKEHRRIRTSLEQLITSSVMAGPAELDSIQARQRVLLDKYPDDAPLNELHRQLETSIEQRREAIAELASTEEIYEIEEDDEHELLAETSDIPTATHATSHPANSATSAISSQGQNHHIPRFLLPAVGVVAIVAGAVFIMVPRTVHFDATPEGTVISIEGQECHVPCSIKLRAGSHALTASHNGFQSLRTTINVSYFETQFPALKLTEVPKALPAAQMVQGRESTLDSSGNALIVVETSTSAAFVFADGSANAIGQTDGSGRYQFATSAGTHQIKVQKFGYAESPAQTVSAKVHGQAFVSFNLKPQQQSNPMIQLNPNPRQSMESTIATKSPAAPATQPTAAPVQTFVVIQAPTGAEIHIDQQAAGHSTGSPLKSIVEPGQRTIEVFLQGYKPWKETIAVDIGTQAEVFVNLSPIPVVAAPSTNVPPQRSSGASEEDRKQIQQLVDKYASAVEHRDLKQLHEAWPDMPKNQLDLVKSLSKDHKGVSLALTVDKISILEGGEDAVVKCKQILHYDGTLSEASVTIYMGKLGAAWIITKIPRSN